ALVFGHVDVFSDRVDRAGLVRERAHRGTRDALPRFERIALPHQTQIVLLARQPGAPRRRATRTIDIGAVENAVGVDDRAVRRELQRADTAGRIADFTVARIDPAVVRRDVARAAIGSRMPQVRAAVRRGLTAARDDA